MKKSIVLILTLALCSGLCASASFAGEAEDAETAVATESEVAEAADSADAEDDDAAAEAADAGESEGDSEGDSAEVAATEVLDYSDAANWISFGEGEGEADLFFVCPTTTGGDDGSVNMAMTEENMEAMASECQAYFNAFGQDAVIYSPYYQQCTLVAALYMGDEVEEAGFDNAYEDVKAAFSYYLENADPERPLILAGHSQGSLLLLRLMKDFFQDEALQDRLVASYLLGGFMSEEDVEEYPWLVPATGEFDTGVIVMYNTEAEGVTDSITVHEGEKSYCINPLNWVTDSTPADASLNKGMLMTDSETGEEICVPGFTGAYINEERGTLIPTEVDPEEWYVPIFPEGVFHAFDLPFFFTNIQDNVADRLAAWLDAE